MMVKKVWIFIAVAVLLTTVVTSKQHPGVESSQGDLTGANNRSEVSGNWKLNPLQDKWHAKTTSRTGLNVQLVLHEGSQDVSKRSSMEASIEENHPAAKLLYHDEDSLKILSKTTSTVFFSELGNGKLSVNKYREYLALEAIVLQNVYGLCDEAFKTMLTPEKKNDILAKFFLRMRGHFQDHFKLFITAKKIDPNQQKASEALEFYMGSLRSKLLDPELLLVAILQREWFYTNLAKLAFTSVVNVYKKDWRDVFTDEKGLTLSEKVFQQTYEEKRGEAYLNSFRHFTLELLNVFLALDNKLPLTMFEVRESV